MMQGRVNKQVEAVIRLQVRGAEGIVQEVEAVIDTGYNGWLTLPEVVIAALGLAWDRRGRALLADGSESIFDMYEGRVFWDGQWQGVAVDAANTTPLVGTGLLYGYRFCMETIAGGNVVIEKLAIDP